MSLRVAALIVSAIALSGCDNSLESQQAATEKFVKNNRYGSSPDAWLLKYNAFGQWERVGLVFGFLDDQRFCEEIAALYVRKYPADRYMCLAAN